MASFNRPEAKQCRPALLKDYLIDDMSSCSSNGFKSYPRSQCCTTVRFLLDRDLKLKPSITPSSTRLHPRPQLQMPASSKTSVFQKASEAVLNAVKLLSIHNRSSLKSGFLSRSFSRKVFKRTFWKKKNVDWQIQNSEIHRWKTFHNLISTFPETPPYCIPITTTTTPKPTITTPTTITITPSSTTTTTATTTTDSKDSSSWSENEFTSEVRSSGSSSADKEKDWVARDEKEQFSPVSVLENPFHGEDGDDASFTEHDSKLVHRKGEKKRVIKRHGRFKTLEEMEPVNLDTRLAALSEMGNNIEITDTTNLDAEKAQRMLEQVKSRVEIKSIFCADNLLLDFFMDSFDEKSDDRLTEEAVCFLTSEWKEMGFDWRVEASRKLYIKDMEKGGNWKHVEDQRTDVVKEIVGGVWNSLLNEMINELVVD